MAVNTVITNRGKAMQVDRLRTSATYTTEPKWTAMGTGGTTAAVTDTALGTEVETRGVGVSSIVTTSVTGDTYQVVATQTATATRAITEGGLFDQLASGGNMFASATFTTVNLANGDSLQFTWKDQLT